MKEEEIEALLKEKGISDWRITSEHIDACIKDEAYYNFPGTNVIVCCLTLHNGFNILGESSCVYDDNFDVDIGTRLALDNAREKIWLLEGYLLRDRLHDVKLKRQEQND